MVFSTRGRPLAGATCSGPLSLAFRGHLSSCGALVRRLGFGLWRRLRAVRPADLGLRLDLQRRTCGELAENGRLFLQACLCRGDSGVRGGQLHFFDAQCFPGFGQCGLGLVGSVGHHFLRGLKARDFGEGFFCGGVGVRYRLGGVCLQRGQLVPEVVLCCLPYDLPGTLQGFRDFLGNIQRFICRRARLLPGPEHGRDGRVGTRSQLGTDGCNGRLLAVGADLVGRIENLGLRDSFSCHGVAPFPVDGRSVT